MAPRLIEMLRREPLSIVCITLAAATSVALVVLIILSAQTIAADSEASEAFDELTATFLSRTHAALDSALLQLQVVGGLFELTAVNSDMFVAFLDALPGLNQNSTIVWAEAVLRGDLAAFEQRVRDEVSAGQSEARNVDVAVAQGFVNYTVYRSEPAADVADAVLLPLLVSGSACCERPCSPECSTFTRPTRRAAVCVATTCCQSKEATVGSQRAT
jgi:hypothetical protein